MTSGMATIPSAKDVSGEERRALVELLYRLGDDGLIIGHRNSEWTGLGPILEEDIAFSSMAQDKMGHALAYYGLLHDLGEPAPDDLAFARPAEAFRCCGLVTLDCASAGAAPATSLQNNPQRDRLVACGDWALSFMRQFLFSQADALRTTALEESAYEPLARVARKLRGELKYHTLHGRTLLRMLGKGGAEGRGRMQAALDTLYPHGLGMFETTAADAVIVEAGLGPDEVALCQRWREAVEPALTDAGLNSPRDAQPINGGRVGRHPADLTAVREAMRKVYRLSPGARW